MNLPNEENNLPLFKYNPEITSQLLIQTREPQEFVQVPSICDDLMLTSLEDGTVTWTLGGLPVLLNGLNDQPHLLLNQLSSAESTEELQSQQDIVISDLLEQCTNDNQMDAGAEDENVEMVYPLELPEKEFLTDTGLFTTHTDVMPSGHNLTSTANGEQSLQAMQPEALADEIQSSDVSSQGSFIDINGLLIPQQSILNVNSPDLLFNLQDTNQATHNRGNIVFGNVQKKVKNVKLKSKSGVSLLRSAAKREQTVDAADKARSVVFDGASLIRVLTGDGSNAVLNVDGAFFGAKPDEQADLQAAAVAVDEEPDSTVTSDDTDDSLNIDDLATVITAYRCKRCEFTCNDRDTFFAHFRETHLKPRAVEQIYRLNQNFIVASQEASARTGSGKKCLERKNKLTTSSMPTFKIFCTNGEITNILASSEQPVLETTVCTVAEEPRVAVQMEQDHNEIHIPTIELHHGARIYVSDSHLLQLPASSDGLEMAISEQDLQQLMGAGAETSPAAPQTISFLCKNNEITGIAMLAAEHEDTEKKIMRVKRKKRKVPDSHRIISFVSDLSLDDAVHIVGEEREELVHKQPPFEAAASAREKQLIYLCSQCAEQFLTVEECRAHMVKEHKLCAVEVSENGHKDQEAGSVDPLHIGDSTPGDTTSVREQNKKIIEKFLTQDILKPRKIKCTKRGCPYRFARPELLARHMACHVEGVRGQFRCPECSEMHNSWRLCSVHLWRCHQLDIDMYACPLCTYKGSTYVKLKHHMKIHGEERDYVCPECGRGFKQASQLRNHRVIHLDRQVQEVPKWYVQKHCDKCGKLFADSKCLKKHVQAVHSKLKPFICNVCGHSCARKAMLQMHLRQHTGEKPYACKLCLYKTGDHNSLRRHVMRHSGTRPYKCPHCAYTAIQSNSYKNHLASKHPGMSGSYSCTECSFKTVNQESYTSHMNEHRSEVTKVACPVSMIYDALSESSSNNDTTIYTVPSNVIIIPGAKKNVDADDEETQNCFLSLSDLTDEQTVDTGGITIPAESDHSNHM